MDETNHINVNHEVLLWARESLALNRTRAAEITDISVKRLEQLEEGDKQPSFDELKGMAKAYKRTIATLLLQVPPLEKPLPPDRRTVDSTELGKFHEKTIVAVRKARALAESLVELKQDAGISITRFQHRASIQDTSAWVPDDSVQN
jgi:transcriptional regulator with XRE-family HTH domain